MRESGVYDNSIKIRRPDDWHLHLRDGELMRHVIGYTSEVFARAIVMPNLVPPLTTVAAIDRYREQITAAIPSGHRFEPLMTCYLTDTIELNEIESGFNAGRFVAAKLYPAGATTNSQFGVTAIENIYPQLELMQKLAMPLLVHGEVVSPDTDIFDREALFIDQVLEPLRRRFPELRVVLEHITTRVAADYVSAQSAGLAATITPHHLMINRNALFHGGLRPHVYCLPIVKREQDRLALRKVATSGDPRFFLGTDSAPHTVNTKECDGGCAGVFNAPTAMACVAQVFDEEDALARLEAFTSVNGARFYGVDLTEEWITLSRRSAMDEKAVTEVTVADQKLRIFTPDAGLLWQVQSA